MALMVSCPPRMYQEFHQYQPSFERNQNMCYISTRCWYSSGLIYITKSKFWMLLRVAYTYYIRTCVGITWNSLTIPAIRYIPLSGSPQVLLRQSNW